jgi:hypothetical protein
MVRWLMGMSRAIGLRGWRAAVLLVAAGSLSFGAWTALAQSVTVTATPDPLPGSQFQGGDGNQDNAPGLIDWQGLQADGRVGHTSDPQANDNIFAGGSKELQPGNWGLTTQAGGLTPGKDNILDAYRAFDHAPGGDVFLYLAFTRFAGNGDSFVTFELNQDARMWRNSAGATIPCRTTGDILISFDDHSNGAPTDVTVERWVTDTAASNGCANTGHLEAASLTPNVDVEASYNDGGAITNYLPGYFGIGSLIPQRQFGEAAINLTTVLGGLGEQCAVFGSTWMHSRSSLSDTSDMKDYVAPQPFEVRTCKASPALTSSASGNVNHAGRGKNRLRRHRNLSRSLAISDTAILSGGDNPTGTITFTLYGPDDASCTGTPAFVDSATADGNGAYQSGAFTPTSVGTYRWVVTYSGDDNNNAAGPTTCGADSEAVVISPASPTLSSQAFGPLRRFHRRGLRPPHRRRSVRLHTGRAGQQIYDTANLEGGFAPTGTITFQLYGPDDATCSRGAIFTSSVPVNGNGSYDSAGFTPTAAGTYYWVLSYSGDANNNPAGPTACGDPTETTVIAKAQPALSTVASGATTVGSPIQDRASLSGGADPTGQITFNVYGPDDATCSGSVADTSTVSVSGNGDYTSAPFTPTRAGTYRWVASYSGDGNNDAVTTFCDDAAEAVVVGNPTVHPTLTSTASASAPAGSSISDTAHLAGGSGPTGTITFSVYGPDDNNCSLGAVDTSTVSVSGNGNYTSAPFTPSDAGTYRWIAEYSGDATNEPAGPTTCGDPAETVVVSKAQPVFSTAAIASTALPGFTQDAAILDGAHPGGTIRFELFGPNDSTCAGTPVFTADVNVVGNGVYRSPTFYPSNAGTYHWVASYLGDANNNPAATACGDSGETTVVLPHQPSLTTSASPPARLHPRARRARAAGMSIYDAATLTGFAPTGQITFDLYGPDDATCSRLPIFTTAATVNGNGIYNSESFTPSTSGTYRWRATYSGDANNDGVGPTDCADSGESVQVTVPADTSLTTSASDAVELGGSIHDTATLTDGSSPTGTITFRLYAPTDTTCSGDPVFTSTVPVSGNGDYTSDSFTPTSTGDHRWVASYSGDNTNLPAGTGCGETGETTVVRPHDISPVAPDFSTTASAGPALGAPIYDTAHLNGGTDPGGAITFTLFGPDDPTCSGTPSFTTTTAVDGNGDYRSSAFVVTVAGTYRWVATYAGDAMNTPVATGCGDPAETATVSAGVRPEPPVGPDVPTPPKPKPKPKQKVRAKAKHRVRPTFTG